MFFLHCPANNSLRTTAPSSFFKLIHNLRTNCYIGHIITQMFFNIVVFELNLYIFDTIFLLFLLMPPIP